MPVYLPALCWQNGSRYNKQVGNIWHSFTAMNCVVCFGISSWTPWVLGRGRVVGYGIGMPVLKRHTSKNMTRTTILLLNQVCGVEPFVLIMGYTLSTVPLYEGSSLLEQNSNLLGYETGQALSPEGWGATVELKLITLRVRSHRSNEQFFYSFFFYYKESG